MNNDRVARTTMGAQLFDLGMALAQRSRERKERTHLHCCACGDYFVCSQEQDKCAVPVPFQCYGCAMEELDAHVEAAHRECEGK